MPNRSQFTRFNYNIFYIFCQIRDPSEIRPFFDRSSITNEAKLAQNHSITRNGIKIIKFKKSQVINFNFNLKKLFSYNKFKIIKNKKREV
jgi:hypothetical protein